MQIYKWHIFELASHVIVVALLRLPTSGFLPYISLLEVKDNCFYMSTKWVFTGISG